MNRTAGISDQAAICINPFQQVQKDRHMDVNWKEIAREALDYLKDYISINTTNPPGNEKPAADYIKSILEKEDLEVEALAADPDRPNLICRLKGDGSKKPLILLHHMDVVLAEKDKWTVDPFGGEERDGYIWGRGALDMKGLGIMELMAFLLARRLALPLKRDLIYIAVPDEETGGGLGAEWLVENHGQKIQAEFLLNEMGCGVESGAFSHFNLAIGEKGPIWLHLSTEGTPGHGSIPRPDNPCVRLTRALNRIAEYQPPLKIIKELHPFLDKVGIGRTVSLKELSSHPILANPAVKAMFMNTVNLTVLKAGEKENVVPSRAEAMLDCRLLPGEDQDSFLAELEALIGDPEIKIEISEAFQASVSPVDTGMYQALEEILTENFPGIPVLPIVSTGFTDSRCFRKMGTHCYGLIPLLIEMDVLGTIHGHDERLPVKDLDKGIRVIFDLIGKLCLD